MKRNFGPVCVSKLASEVVTSPNSELHSLCLRTASMRHGLGFEMSLTEHTANHELWEKNPSGLLRDHKVAQPEGFLN